MQLKSLAKVIRSKNAGPCLLTLDLMLTDKAAFAYVVERVATLRRLVAERYRRSENEVAVLPFAPALAVKITFPRDVISHAIDLMHFEKLPFRLTDDVLLRAFESCFTEEVE